MKERQYVRYGEAFKRQVVAEIEGGKFVGAATAARAYGIGGSRTISRWQRKYGHPELMAKKVYVMSKEEQDENKALKRRVRELENALANAYMGGLLKDSYLEIACEQLGIEVEAFKKKHVTKLSDARPGKENR